MHEQTAKRFNRPSGSSTRLFLKKNFFNIMVLLPAVAYIGIFFLIIVINLIVFSFTNYVGGFAQEPTLLNYTRVLASPEFQQAYTRTLAFMLVVTPLQLITGLIVASLLNKSFRGRGIARGVMLIPLALPVLVTASVFFILFSKNGHINALLLGQYPFFPKLINAPVTFIGTANGSFILTVCAKVWRDTPASVLILLAGMQSIDGVQYEAAKTMGAKPMQTFLYITVPLLIPSISSVLVLRSIEAWKEFVFPYILAPSFPLLSVIIDRYFTQQRDPGITAVVGLILIASIVIFSQILKFLLSLIQKRLLRV